MTPERVVHKCTGGPCPWKADCARYDGVGVLTGDRAQYWVMYSKGNIVKQVWDDPNQTCRYFVKRPDKEKEGEE